MILAKRKNGIYYIQFFDNEEQKIKRVSTSSRNKKEALKFLNNFNESFKSISSKQSISLINFKDEYVKFIGQTYSKKYLQSIELSFRQLLKFTNDISLRKISVRLAQEFLSMTFKRTEKGAELYLRTLKAAFNRAVDWGYIQDNPFKKVKLPKSQKSYPIFINESELDIILEHTNKKELKNLYVVAFNTGMRLGELTNLKWENIDLEGKMIIVKNDISFSTKNRKDRIIPMSKKVLDLFQKKYSSKQMSVYVFSKSGGIKFNNDYVTKYFKKAVRKAELNDKIHFHTLRHSFASRLVQRGASIYVVKELLGHSDVTTTQIYSHLEQSNLKEVINLM
jgi:site-specific recombinase XerD